MGTDFQVHFVGEGIALTDEDRVCVPVPYYHCFGMVMGNLVATSHGACVVLPGDAFEPAAVLRAVQAELCTALYGVPTMFIAMLDALDGADERDHGFLPIFDHKNFPQVAEA